MPLVLTLHVVQARDAVGVAIHVVAVTRVVLALDCQT